MGNIIPASTGAAQAVVKVLPELKGKFHGEYFLLYQQPFVLMYRYLNSSASHECIPGRPHCPSRIPSRFQGRAYERFPDRFRWSTSGCPKGIIDADASVMLDDKTAKIVAWYDNEYGFASRMCDLVVYMRAISIKNRAGDNGI
jgi:glyceraldehyde 3-phosphate dehydrogenase